MRKSQILIEQLSKNTNRIIRNVLQATISNEGSSAVKIFGLTHQPGERFVIDATNTVSDIKLQEIEFDVKGDPATNNVVIVYQILHIEQC